MTEGSPLNIQLAGENDDHRSRQTSPRANGRRTRRRGGAGHCGHTGRSTGAKPGSDRAKSGDLRRQADAVRPREDQGLSEKILTSHYANNYTGAVKRLNQITEQLAGLDYAKAPGFLINGLKREELIATNSVILHEVYFAGLGPEESRPWPALAEALARDFGSFEWWRTQFVAMGKAEGGSGWVLLTWDPRG
jgi:superoxide dismutase, Fe-Mn family